MISHRFVLALNPQQYLNAGDGVGVREIDEANFAASDVIDSLKENDALCINAQLSFDGVFHCERAVFAALTESDPLSSPHLQASTAGKRSQQGIGYSCLTC